MEISKFKGSILLLKESFEKKTVKEIFDLVNYIAKTVFSLIFLVGIFTFFTTAMNGRKNLEISRYGRNIGTERYNYLKEILSKDKFKDLNKELDKFSNDKDKALYIDKVFNFVLESSAKKYNSNLKKDRGKRWKTIVK